jgi:hypothetical protein
MNLQHLIPEQCRFPDNYDPNITKSDNGEVLHFCNAHGTNWMMGNVLPYGCRWSLDVMRECLDGEFEREGTPMQDLESHCTCLHRSIQIFKDLNCHIMTFQHNFEFASLVSEEKIQHKTEVYKQVKDPEYKGAESPEEFILDSIVVSPSTWLL